jgi:hypothetical protein
VTNEERLNALKVRLTLQILPNEKVTIQLVSCTELFGCQKENKFARNRHLYDQLARPQMRPIKIFLNISSVTLN